MSIEKIKFGLGSIKAPSGEMQTPPAPAPAGGKGSFADLFEQAVRDVNRLQNDANQRIEDLMLQKPGVTTHDAMIALEKADIAFQMMNQVRSKIIRAYEEVIRTQV